MVNGRTLSLQLVVMLGVVLILSFAFPELAWAGPGGVFVKVAAKSPIGQALFGIAAILLLPFILYVIVAERLGIRRTRRDLERLAQVRPEFAWAEVSAQATAAIEAICEEWESGELDSAAEFLVPEYLHSQQALLDRWKDEGKRSVFRLHRLGRMAPLHVAMGDPSRSATIAMLVSGLATDYLEDAASRKVLKGKRAASSEYESVWVFSYYGDRWRVARIEEGTMSLVFAKLKNEITLPELPERVASKPSVAQAPAHETPAKHERTPAKVAKSK